MIPSCDECGSTHIIKKGTRHTGEGLKYRYKCRGCGKTFSVLEQEVSRINCDESVLIFTSAITGSPVNTSFLKALEQYAKHRNGRLMVLPIRYKNPTRTEEDIENVEECDPALREYLVEEAYIDDERRFRALCDLKIQATAVNPLSGMEPMARGYNTVIGHPQLQMQSITQRDNSIPVFLTTTGAVTVPVFSDTKAGYKANFHHSYSAVVVEFSENHTFMRQLSFDGDGFYDIDHYYSEYGVDIFRAGADALIVGDEHVMFMCPKVKEATYTNPDSIVNTFRPGYIVRHDVLDCYTVSHHHNNNFMVRMKKHLDNQNNIEKELRLTLDHISDTTPEYAKTIIVASNHNEHIGRFLNETDPKRDLVNAKVYHMLMYAMLDYMETHGKIGDPFKMFAKMNDYPVEGSVEYIGRNDSFTVHGIELADHGDAGFNGSRGSRKQYANLSTKSVIGHSHSPGIDKGCYQVGTSSGLRMEYNKGPSSWANTHCIIYPNGKRQLISIIDGEWRA